MQLITGRIEPRGSPAVRLNKVHLQGASEMACHNFAYLAPGRDPRSGKQRTPATYHSRRRTRTSPVWRADIRSAAKRAAPLQDPVASGGRWDGGWTSRGSPQPAALRG